MNPSARLTARPGPRPPGGPPFPPGVTPLGVGPRAAQLVVPTGPTGPVPLLVFFHGAGGSAAGSLPAVLPLVELRGAAVLLPSSSASTWDLVTGRPGPDVQALDALLRQVEQRHPVDRVALGGFSDGASYALSLGLANGDLVAQVLAFSPGFAAPPEQVGRPRIWVSHGTEDGVLPVDVCGRRVVRTLRTAGYDVDYHEFAGGHVVTPALVARAAAAWLGAGSGAGGERDRG